MIALPGGARDAANRRLGQPAREVEMASSLMQ